MTEQALGPGAEDCLTVEALEEEITKRLAGSRGQPWALILNDPEESLRRA
jgi:hypothetical protein